MVDIYVLMIYFNIKHQDFKCDFKERFAESPVRLSASAGGAAAGAASFAGILSPGLYALRQSQLLVRQGRQRTPPRSPELERGWQLCHAQGAGGREGPSCQTHRQLSAVP